MSNLKMINLWLEASLIVSWCSSSSGSSSLFRQLSHHSVGSEFEREAEVTDIKKSSMSATWSLLSVCSSQKRRVTTEWTSIIMCPIQSLLMLAESSRLFSCRFNNLNIFVFNAECPRRPSWFGIRYSCFTRFVIFLLLVQQLLLSDDLLGESGDVI